MDNAVLICYRTSLTKLLKMTEKQAVWDIQQFFGLKYTYLFFQADTRAAYDCIRFSQNGN